MSTPQYLHVLDGRLRIKVPELKRSNSLAAVITDNLLRLEGVTEVNANPLTGNVLVLFDTYEVTALEILDVIGKYSAAKTARETRLPKAASSKNPFQPNRLARMAVEVALQTTMEIAVKRLVFAIL
jgi:copper chaperone CopZ